MCSATPATDSVDKLHEYVCDLQVDCIVSQIILTKDFFPEMCLKQLTLTTTPRPPPGTVQTVSMVFPPHHPLTLPRFR